MRDVGKSDELPEEVEVLVGELKAGGAFCPPADFRLNYCLGSGRLLTG